MARTLSIPPIHHTKPLWETQVKSRARWLILCPTSSRGLTFKLKKKILIVYFFSMAYRQKGCNVDVNRYRYITSIDLWIGFEYSTIEHQKNLADL